MVRQVIGAAGLLVAWAASLMLVLAHLRGMSLPGCGPGSPCAEAAASVWGKIPGLEWPTSFVGLTYFSAMLTVWLWTRGALRGVLMVVAILGGLGSIALTVVMFAGGYVCQYCLAAHVGNLVFLGATLWPLPAAKAPKQKTVAVAPRTGLAAFAMAVVVATAGLYFAERIVNMQVREQGERDLEETSRRLTDSTSERKAFTGRYLTGPVNAPIRMVVFSDYQCKDCGRVESEIRQLLAERSDLSLSAKHFPMSTVCNEHMSRDMHPNACWAARAAEAAGILRGNDGFWQMHHWLFDRGGGFTDAELHAGLQQMGYDVNQFLQVMTGPETLKLVQADIEEAIFLGIHFTPMVFLNGVEVKGAHIPGAVRRMVDVVAATNPQPAAPHADQPPSAAEKFVADWRDQPKRPLPASALSWPRGAAPASATVRIVMWGDLQEPNCANADRQIRAYLDSHSDVSYEFRPYPVDQSCNSHATKTLFPYGCVAAKAALAAGQLGGGDAYWNMHEWLMANQVPLDGAALAQAAQAAGVDHAALLSTMESPAIASAIALDAQVAKNYALASLPMVWVNDRWVPRWFKEEDPQMLKRILDAARAGN